MSNFLNFILNIYGVYGGWSSHLDLATIDFLRIKQEISMTMKTSNGI